MVELKQLIYELKNYGIHEVVNHILWRLTFDEKFKTSVYKDRDKFYKIATEAQMEYELCRYFRSIMNRNLDVKNPIEFTDKIQYIKLHGDILKMSKLADKYLVRDWVTSKIGKEYLIPLLGVWNHFSEIDFDLLPSKFVLKMNHGSGMNIIVKDKTNMELNNIRNTLNLWSDFPFYAFSLEYQYKDISRKILAEQYIEEMSGGLFDYKFHCFNGEPLFIQCIGDRNFKTHTGYQMNYDLNWKPLDWIFEDYPAFSRTIPKPLCLNEMVQIARKLSKDFPYVRVDLYEICGKVLFGEMTFTPASGIYPYKGTWTREKDIELGNALQL